MNENETKQWRIRELLDKLECEIKDCRRILRGEKVEDSGMAR